MMHAPNQKDERMNTSQTPWVDDDQSGGIGIADPGTTRLSDDESWIDWSDYPIGAKDDEMDEDERYFLEEDDDDDDDDDSDTDSDYDDGFDDEDDDDVDSDEDSDDDHF